MSCAAGLFIQTVIKKHASPIRIRSLLASQPASNLCLCCLRQLWRRLFLLRHQCHTVPLDRLLHSPWYRRTTLQASIDVHRVHKYRRALPSPTEAHIDAARASKQQTWVLQAIRAVQVAISLKRISTFEQSSAHTGSNSITGRGAFFQLLRQTAPALSVTKRSPTIPTTRGLGVRAAVSLCILSIYQRCHSVGADPVILVFYFLAGLTSL